MEKSFNLRKKKMNNFQHGIDYEYVVNEKDKNLVHIKLLTGPYKETIYKYGKVTFDEKDNQLYLQFAFDVLSSPIKKLDKKVEFKNYIGELLTTIITGNLDMDENYYDENRTNDTEESNLQ